MAHDSARTKTAVQSKHRSLMSGVAHALWSLVTPADFESTAPTEKGVRFSQTKRRGIQPLADVYIPEGPPPPGGFPSVVLIHGGGFVLGSRDMKPVRFLTAKMHAAGLAVCSVDYRLVFRGGRLDEALDDVSEAVSWWRSGNDRWSLNPGRISVLGVSAGATLALLTASDNEAGPFERVVSVFGLYDFAHLQGPLARVLPRLVTRSRNPNHWENRSPVAAEQTSSPVLFIHGTADALVPVQHAEAMVERRKRSGLPTELVLYDDAPHAFFNWECPERHKAAAEIVRFLTQTSDEGAE
jgi:acetyl esterase/lipase